MLFRSVLPSDQPFSQSLSNAYANVIYSTLGDERSALLRQYSWSWMESLGMLGADSGSTEPTSMTIRRDRNGNGLTMNLQQPNSSMSSGIWPSQSLPEAFRPLFPGGWKELAEREGFELPPEFRAK